MKRLFIVLLATLAVALQATAQDVVRDSTAVADTADTEENVIGATPTPRKYKSKSGNVLGAPVYYDLNGNRIGDGLPSADSTVGQQIYRRPKHHYLNNLDDRYSTFFFEGEVLVGSSSMGLGANLTILPERWGGYGSVVFGMNEGYFSVGPVLRLSGYDSWLDWQLYGGLVLGDRHLGAEGGLRVAAPKRNGELCWTSMSLGFATLNGDVYMTMGFSLDMLAVFGATTFLFW